MGWNETELSYRRSSIEGANLVGLTVALYDTLAGDLSRASRAVKQNDIEARCKEANHALLVLGHLESWLDPIQGVHLTQSLTSFYGYVRMKIMDAQAQSAASIFDDLSTLVVQIRATWQQLDLRNAELRKSANVPPRIMHEQIQSTDAVRTAWSCSA